MVSVHEANKGAMKL